MKKEKLLYVLSFLILQIPFIIKEFNINDKYIILDLVISWVSLITSISLFFVALKLDKNRKILFNFKKSMFIFIGICIVIILSFFYAMIY